MKSKDNKGNSKNKDSKINSRPQHSEHHCNTISPQLQTTHLHLIIYKILMHYPSPHSKEAQTTEQIQRKKKHPEHYSETYMSLNHIPLQHQQHHQKIHHLSNNHHQSKEHKPYQTWTCHYKKEQWDSTNLHLQTSATPSVQCQSLKSQQIQNASTTHKEHSSCFQQDYSK